MRTLTIKEKVLLYLLIACWIVLAADFVFRTSHVSIDGVRYYSLFDDGMISMRYAKNLINRHGLVWNVGERVEGFTNPLWTLLMAGVIWCCGTHYAPLAMQALGGLICLSTFGTYCRCGIRNCASGFAILTGLLLLVFSYPVSYWALTGMEASAVCLTLAIAARAQYSYENGSSKNPLLLLAGSMALAYCLRPDGWLAITPFFAASWYDAIKERKYRSALFASAIFAAVVGAVLVGRFLYYGELVPNTYVLKVEGYPLSLRIKNGLAFVRLFCVGNYPVLILILLAVVSKRRVAFLNATSAVIVLGYQIYVGGDPWLYWRQLLPVYLLSAFSVLLVFDYLDKVYGTFRNEHMPSTLARALLVTITSAPIVLLLFRVHTSSHSLSHWRESLLLPLFGLAAFAVVINLDYAKKKLIISRTDLLKPAVRAPIVVSPRMELLGHFCRALLVVITIGAIVLGNAKFVPQLANKPYSYGWQGKLIDKAVLSTRLFGPGRTHHVVWAGTYPYYIEGTAIDALGKSVKEIARLPVDKNISWGGMSGVPGHAKYDFRNTILQRQPDIIVDFVAYGGQDLTQNIKNNYTLIDAGGVMLCARRELAASLKNLATETCPRDLL